MRQRLAFILILALLLGMSPATAFVAAPADAVADTPVESRAMNTLDGPYSVWNSMVATSFARGDGSETTPYIIETAEQLAYLAHSVNQGNSYAGKYIDLASDIDLNRYPWTPIGLNNTFSGRFDGNGFSIYNLVISVPSVPSAPHWGFFGATTGYCWNLNIVNATLTCTSGKTGLMAGLLVGYSNSADFENCTVSGRVEIQTEERSVYAGGMAGKALPYSTFVQCAADVTVAVSAKTSQLYTAYVGGLIGDAQSSTTISQCKTAGTVSATDIDHSYVGGIAGYGLPILSDSYSTANVSSTGGTFSAVGGLLGHANNNGIKISGCYATGAVYCEAPAGGNGSSYAGGLAGYIQNGTVENNYAGNPSVQCLYTNVVKDAESYAGRLFGGFVVFGGGNNYVNGAMTIKRSRYVAAVTGCNGTPESMGTLTEPSEQPENGTFTYGSQNPRQVVGWGVYGASATFSPWVDDGNNPVLYMERRVGYRVTYMLDGNVINLTYKEGMPKEEVNIVTPQMVGYEPDLHGVGFSTNGGQKTITYTHVHVAEGEATCLQPQRCTICLVEMSGLGAHQFEAGASDPVPPTCEENGYTLYTCILCAEEVKRDFVPPTGHLLDDHCTCTLCGEQFPAPLRDYAVFVFDSETTHPIAEARVQIGDLAVYTDAQGAARFQLAPDTAAPLSIEKDGYPDYENASFVLGQMPYTYVYLQSSESGIYEAWCNGDNVLLMDSQINNLSPALTAHVVVAGRAQAPITKYELVQDGQVIATSTTGAFLVKNPHFKQNVPVYARMHTEGQEGHNLFEQQLNIAVVGFSFTAELDDLFPFVTGLNIDFTDGSPLLSGVSLKLPGFRENDTIHVSAGNNKVVISYGVEKDYFDKDVDTKNAAEIMKKLRDKFVQQNNPHFWPKGKAKSEVTAAGAFVLEIGKDSSITAAYGEIHVGYELSYKWGKTFAVWVVPVYVGFKAGLQGELTITDLGYDIENSKFLIPDADFTLQAEIAAYGGLGCSLLSAGVYGAVGGEITVGAKDLQEYFRYMLYGEMGVYVRVDLFFWKEIEYRLPLLHGSIFGPNGQIKSRRAMLSMANYQTGLRQYLENRSDWLATALLAAAGGEAHSLLQSSSYSAIQPRIVTLGDTRMMLFLDDDGSEGFNYQHLYYSLFDTATNTWGTPQRVDDSPFADLEYDVYADENGIYLAYTKAGDITAENEEDYAAVLSQVEVYTAHYDAETGRFAGHTNLSCNDSYDSQPQVTGEAVLWVNNLTGDVLSENANNTLVLSEKTATGWGAPRPLGDRGATVTSLDMGMLSGETCIALIRDTDCDLTTETDRQVALMTTSGEVYAVPTAAGTNAGVRFATAGGQEAVQWYGEGNIWQLTEPDGAPTALLAEPLPGLTDEFCHLQLDEETEVLLFAQNGMADGVAGSRLYAIYHTGEGWGQPVPLTDSIPEQYIDAFDACVYNGDLLLSYLVTEATFTDTDFTRTSYFMSSRIPTKYDLAVGEAVCLESELFSGPTIDWHLPVTNLSRDPLKQVTVQVQTAAGAPVYDQILTPESPIGSGDTGYVTFTLPKDRLDNTRAYRLFVTTPDWWDENRDNNYAPLSLWYTDFEVTAQQMLHGSTPELHYAVANNGNIAGTGRLHIYRQEGEQKITLHEEELSLAVGATHTGAVTVTDAFFADPAAELGTVRVEVLPALPERYNFNNGQSLQVGGLTKSGTEQLPAGEAALPAPTVTDPYALYDKHKGGDLSAPVSERGWVFTGVKELAEGEYRYQNGTLQLSAALLQSLSVGYHYYTLTFQREGQTAEANFILEITDTTPPPPPLTAEDVTVPYTGGPVRLTQLNYQTPSTGVISTRYTAGDGWVAGLPTALGTYTVELAVAEDSQNAYGPATVQFRLTVVKGTRAISTPLQFREEAGRIRFEGALPTAGVGDGTVWYGYSTQNDVTTVTEWSDHGLLPLANEPTRYYVFAKVVDGQNYEDAYSPGFAAEAHIHRYISTVTPPAVGSGGYTTHRCTACEHTYTDTFVEAIPLVGGDATGDGVVTAEDVNLLRRYVAAKDPATGLSPIEVCAGADADGDGVINTKDIILAQRVLEGGAL